MIGALFAEGLVPRRGKGGVLAPRTQRAVVLPARVLVGPRGACPATACVVAPVSRSAQAVERAHRVEAGRLRGAGSAVCALVDVGAGGPIAGKAGIAVAREGPRPVGARRVAVAVGRARRALVDVGAIGPVGPPEGRSGVAVPPAARAPEGPNRVRAVGVGVAVSLERLHAHRGPVGRGRALGRRCAAQRAVGAQRAVSGWHCALVHVRTVRPVECVAAVAHALEGAGGVEARRERAARAWPGPALVDVCA